MFILSKKYSLRPSLAKAMRRFLFWAEKLRGCVYVLTILEFATSTLMTTSFEVKNDLFSLFFLMLYSRYKHY